MVERGGKLSFFQGILVRIDIRLDVSISISIMTIKFGKQVHIKNLQVTRPYNIVVLWG